ncbi:ABC transporter substrate-binding protein [Enterovirga aerilata]|uniref:ABC transporter substrate-binding protein n=1 Tax=Enterovirga aerilata TaxID=2730920 RepID=A0A849IAV9_9HYPH|nr:ABC transporter substrate-binding protein [Enterovirga sp. DB1703]NNM74538.1 ABC transporter substrate-binding protein [Enterovirga sp. DB1703]
MRTYLVAAMLLAVSIGTAQAQLSDDVVRIGVLSDMSSWGKDNAGPGSAEGARMAIEEMGGQVLGKKVELVIADHQMKTDIGAQIARAWFDEGKVDAIADVTNSAIAIAVHNLARDKNRVALLSAPGASALTDKLCSPNTVHFTYDTYSLAKVTTQALAAEGAKSWYFVTADYAFGHGLEADAARFIREAGGEIKGGIKHPTGTSDFSSFVLQAQAAKADVVVFANAGADTQNGLKQAGEFGLVKGGQKLAGLLMYETDIHAVGLANAQGTYLTTASYWNMNEGTRAWSKRFFEKMGFMPTMNQVGAYGAVLHYLKAVKAAGTDEAKAVMAKMRELPIEDAFIKSARLRADGRVMRDMYLARVKAPAEAKEPWDYLEIVRTVKADDAYRPESESECPLLRK